MEDKIDDVFISGLLKNILDKQQKSKEVFNVADMSKMLANVTEKVALLKHQIDSGAKTSSNKFSNIDKFIDNYKNTNANEQETTNSSLLKDILNNELKKTTTEAKPTVTEYPDYLGTAQLEVLLKGMKARAIEMVVENPTVADLITNTVTEATFEADPILNHLDISSPGYALTTFVFISKVDNANKRTAKDFGIHVSKRNDENNEHQIFSKWCGKKNIAQSLEDILQSKLKEACQKVKTEVTDEYEKEISSHTGKPKPKTNIGINKKPKTANIVKPKKPSTRQLMDITNPFLENSITASTTKSITNDKISQTTNNIRNVRADKLKMKKNQKVKSTRSMSTLSTVDDFAMLTLYEQILSKTHESNLMNLRATNNHRTNDVTRLSKRNLESLSDLRLKKDVKRKYDDEDNMPDAEPSSFDFHTTKSHVQGTSLQALRDKIAFKEYVNGYKTYLDFQKERGTSDKFSNLVKYQAHKHHKVEDIGKFILNKIPPVPANDLTKRRKRYFFDFDLEKNKQLVELVVPTRSDSWFKKHFYIFERETPSKFRTSETVKFKEVTDPLKSETDMTNSALDEGTRKILETVTGNDINLDDLAKSLESTRHKPAISKMLFFSSSRLPATKKIGNPGKIEIQYKAHNPNPVNDKGKQRIIMPTNNNQKIQNESPKLSEGDNFLFQTNRRRKRKTMKSTQKVIDNDENTLKSKNRDGYVTLVTQPTAIVNLMKTNNGESKIKKLLNKIHIHRKKKKRTKIKKEKRFCTRVQRFNPIKKLRNMFSAKEMNERNNMAYNKNIDADYDMITSRIDTFKAVVYDKLPSLEDLQKQVPSIPEAAYLNGTDYNHKATDVSKTFNSIDCTIKQVQKKNHERKVLQTPKTFTVVLDPYPLHIRTKELHTTQTTVPETTSEMVKTTTSSQSSDRPKSDSDDLYSDYITPFYDLFNRDEKTETDDKIELLNDEKQSTVLHNAIINKINQEFGVNGTKTQSYFKFLKSEMPETTTKFEYREYNPIARLIDEQADDTYLATSTASVKRTPFFSFYDNTITSQAKVQTKHHDRNKLLTERNLFVEAAVRNFETTKTHFETYYTHPYLEQSDSDYNSTSILDYYDSMSESNIDSDYQRWLGHTSKVPKYTTQSINDMQKELRDMGERLAETDHKVKFINSLNEYAINNKMINVRTDLPYKYSNDELEDLVRELNKIYMRRIQSHLVKSLYRQSEPAPNYARNVVKNRKAGKEPIHPIAKLNKQPKQLFNTPLPMTKAQFEKFLKDNKIDVESVTSDLTPNPVKAANDSQPDPVIHKNEFQITGEYNERSIIENPADTEIENNVDYLIGKSDAESQIDYLNNLEQSLNDDYNEIFNERRKRMTPRDDTDEALVGRNHYNKAKLHLTSSKPKYYDASIKKQYELNKHEKPKEDVQINLINIDELNNEEEHVTQPIHPERIAQNFTNILLNALRTFQSKSDINKIDINPDKDKPSNSGEIGFLQDYGHVTKTEPKVSLAAAENPATVSNSDTITNSKLVVNGKQTLKPNKNNTKHNIQSSQAADTDIIEIIEVVKAVDDFTRPEVAVHIDLPVYYAPNNDIDVDVIRPLEKPSWTDLVIKYVSGIALINMLSKVGILKGGLSDLDNLELNFDRFKVSTADGVEVENARDRRTVLNSNRPTTHIEKIHFLLTGPMPKNKRMFGFPFLGRGKTTKMSTTKGTTTQKMTNIVKETSPVTQTDKQTLAEATRVLDKKKFRAAANYEPSTTTHMPFISTKPSEENTIISTLSTANDTFSDVWDDTIDTIEGTSSKRFSVWQTSIEKDTEDPQTAEEEANLGTESDSTTESKIDSITLSAGTRNSAFSITLSAGIRDKLIDTITLSAVTRDPTLDSITIPDSSTDSITLSDGMTDSTKDAKTILAGKTDSTIDSISSTTDFIPSTVDYTSSTTDSTSLTIDSTSSTIDFISSFNDEKSSTSSVTYRILKRDVDGELRTAKGVAAIEIIVDLMRHKGGEEITKQTETVSQMGGADSSESDEDIFTFRPPITERTDASTNSIQVHIAIPYDNGLIKKRAAESVLARKVFSARLASPVDLEYQIHYIDSIKPTRSQTASTTNQAEIVSPGLYLLVDNFNEGNNSFALKPVKISSVSYDSDIVKKQARNVSTNDEQGVKLSKAFLRAVNKHLVDLYNNITESNLTKRATHVKREVVYSKYLKKVLDIFENDRACACNCKVNEPMCGVCAASDAVIKELSFEFDNLGKYMSDHCTEIQTYFKTNPRGGKVLRDCIRRLDKSLDDYNKRNKGKCHGPTCKTFATYLHKRQDDHNSKTEEVNLVDHVTSLNNNFYALSNLIPYVETLKNNGENFIRSAKDCLLANIKKRKCRDAMPKDDEYTFDNISVKFICTPESTSDANNMIPSFDTAATDLMYMDYGFKKRSLKPNILNKFFSRKKKQNNKSYSKKIKHKKRQVDQVESPLIADAGGSFWRDYILRKTTSKPEIVISVVESKKKVKSKTTEKSKQRYAERIESADTSSYNMNDLLSLISTNKIGDQDSKGTRNSNIWMNKIKQTKPSKNMNKKEELHKKNKKIMHNNEKNIKQQNKAQMQCNMSQSNATKPHVNVTVTSVTTRPSSEVPAPDKYSSSLAIIPTTTPFENYFIKKMKKATANFLKKMKINTEGYQLDLGNFMGYDAQREKRTEDKLTTKEMFNTKSFQLISQKSVSRNGKPRFVVVTKPMIINANKQSTINNCKNNKEKQNEKEEKMLGDVVENLHSTEEKENQSRQVDETKFTAVGKTIASWFRGDVLNEPLGPMELDKKTTGETFDDVFEELATPPEVETGSSTIVWRQDTNSGKKEFAKNIKLVLRPNKMSMASFAPDAEKETEHTETTDITDATLAKIEEADPFKTRVAEMSSSAFVPEPCLDGRCHYNIDKRENQKQQDQKDISREKERNLDLNQRYDNVRIYRKTHLLNNNGGDGRHLGKPAVKMKFDRPGFDSYVRGDHGDYRIERDRRKPGTTSAVYVEKKMRKRSFNKVTTDLSSLSGWVQRVTINRFLVSVICFYLCCAAFAAAVSRAFRT